MSINPVSGIISGHFFFVDIVGLSNPSMSTKTQIKKIKVLNSSIKESLIYNTIPQKSRFIFPTGDGMCIGFLQGPEIPIRLAIELHQRLVEYNRGKIPTETIKVRIGLHSGGCFIVKDLEGDDNLWGPGIILARRIMDLADDNHILVSSRMAEELGEFSDEYKRMFRPLGNCTIKHGQSVFVYSAVGDGFGNDKTPTKIMKQKNISSDDIVLQKTITYQSIQVDLTVLDPIKMVVQHKRTYEIINNSEKPIYKATHGIATDVEKKSLEDLNVHIYDNSNNELKIFEVITNSPTTKEFTTLFNKPILKGDKDQGYTLVYEVEEPNRYFENAFLTDVKHFELNFKYPTNSEFCPILYEINQETEEKIKAEFPLKIIKSTKFSLATVNINDKQKGQTIRLEW